MLCASGISLLAVIGIVAMFITHARSYTNHKLVREMQQNSRFALDSIARDIHMAGYGLAIRDSELDQWLPWVTNMTANPLIVDGATTNDPDTITIAAAFNPPVATLGAATAVGATSLTLASGAASFDTSRKSVIYIGRCETARIITKSGSQLTISTDPTATGEGLRFAYTNGTPVELVQAVTYRCMSDTSLFGTEQFMIRDTGSTAMPDWQKMLCCHIENLQAGPASYGTWISVTARTSEPLARSTLGTGSNDYLRTTITSRIIPRNATAFELRN